MRFKKLCLNLIHDRLLLCRLLLITGWILGILLGCLTVKLVPADDSLMHMLIHSHMTIVGGLAVCFLPLFATAIIVWCAKIYYLIPLAFIKAFSFAFVSGLIISAFSDAGWLLRWLYMFADSALSVFFLYLWYSCMKEKSGRERVFISTALCCVAVICMDYFIVAPFVAMLF